MPPFKFGTRHKTIAIGTRQPFLFSVLAPQGSLVFRVYLMHVLDKPFPNHRFDISAHATSMPQEPLLSKDTLDGMGFG